MKCKQFWVKRYLWVTGIVCMILMAAALLRGRDVDTALSESFAWALVAAAIFTGSRYYQARKGIACAVWLDLQYSRATPTGLQYLVYAPRP